MMSSESNTDFSAYTVFKDNQNCDFDVSSKSCKYHATNFALHLVKIIAAIVHFTSYIFIPGWPSDIDAWYDKNIYNPIDKKLAHNKNLEMIRLRITK